MAGAAAEFLTAARATVDTFDRLASDLVARPDSDDLLEPFRRELHKLNGSAATFGFARAGRMAAAMETVVRKWLEAAALDRERRSDVVGNFASAIRAQFATGTEAVRVPGRRLLVVGARDALAAALTMEAAARGYHVERVATEDIEEALEDGAPYAMIAMAPAPVHERLAGAVTVELQADEQSPAPQAPPAQASAPPAPPQVPRAPPHRLPGSTPGAGILDALDAFALADRDAGGTVLVLDDDPVMRTVVGVAAAQVNLAATAVADVAAFRSALADSVPAVVVMDIEVGATSGLDLVREMRAQPPFATVPIIVLSGHRDDATRQAALDAGAADYLLKPVSMPVLAAKLAAWRARGARGARRTPSGGD